MWRVTVARSVRTAHGCRVRSCPNRSRPDPLPCRLVGGVTVARSCRHGCRSCPRPILSPILSARLPRGRHGNQTGDAARLPPCRDLSERRERHGGRLWRVWRTVAPNGSRSCPRSVDPSARDRRPDLLPCRLSPRTVAASEPRTVPDPVGGTVATGTAQEPPQGRRTVAPCRDLSERRERHGGRLWRVWRTVPANGSRSCPNRSRPDPSARDRVPDPLPCRLSPRTVAASKPRPDPVACRPLCAYVRIGALMCA